jgi:vacuolar protein sorting-associated protein 13A/C
MFESLVQKLLESYLGEWITDYKQLHLSVWSGIVEMKNLKVKSELFDHLKLPFRVHDGRIGEIQIKVPAARSMLL